MSPCVFVCFSFFYLVSFCFFLPLCHHVSMYLSLSLYNNDNYPVLHVLCIMRQCLCLFVCLSLYVLVSLCRYSPLSSGLCCFVSLQLFLCLCLCTKLSTNYPLAAPVFLVGVPNPLALPHKWGGEPVYCFTRALHNESNFGTEQPSQICQFLLMYLGVVVSLSFYYTVFDQLPSGGTCFACALYNEANFGTELLWEVCLLFLMFLYRCDF